MNAASVLIAGASRGIGLVPTKEMAARGWRVPAGARHGTGGQFLDRNGLTGARPPGNFVWRGRGGVRILCGPI